MKILCFTLNLRSGVNLSDVGTKPLSTLVCISVCKTHPFGMKLLFASCLSGRGGGGFSPRWFARCDEQKGRKAQPSTWNGSDRSTREEVMQKREEGRRKRRKKFETLRG